MAEPQGMDQRQNALTWPDLRDSAWLRLAGVWIAGSLTGWWLGWAVGLILLGLLALGVMLFVWIRALRHPWLFDIAIYTAVFAFSGVWLLTHTAHVSVDSVARFVTQTPQLAKVQGVVASPVVVTAAQHGDFAAFTHEPPVTFARLAVDHIWLDGGWQQASGMLLMKIDQVDDRLRHDDRIEATGWLAGFGPPRNPGEWDYASRMIEQGIEGRLVLRQRGNWTLLSPGEAWAVTAVRQRMAARAAEALNLGMGRYDEARSLLNLLLLGQRVGDSATGNLHTRFREVGLAHILAISGAHLAILLGLVWLAARLFVSHPPYVALVVLVVLLIYLMMVPLRTPIVRAAIMAGVFCVGYGSGRRIRGMELLAIAALLVLLWRPADLFNPGFQLSFIVVAALVLFANRVADSTRIYSTNRLSYHL